MRILISPAKRMEEDTDSLAWTELPQFIPQTERLLSALRGMSPAQLKALWRCNDAIAAHNVERLRTLELRRNLTPAILAYRGIQYRYMAPGVLEDVQLAYLAAHLRILSGFYGLLRPFDGVAPHRLEMQAKLTVDGRSGLYDFWGGALAEQLGRETDCIVNLASQEYARAVTPHLKQGVRLLTCVFGELRSGGVVEKGTLCKMARGRMVRWLAERQVTETAEIRRFDELGYVFDPTRSSDSRFVFVRRKNGANGG